MDHLNRQATVKSRDRRFIQCDHTGKRDKQRGSSILRALT
ncbi:rCG42953 [Rattus norvegicus]|uniref:RCG42953 n=1 Tax=Rattus norvegicus TaxID=10116 RepID=A6IVL4_RAT|nr:rCG42953 [Rattus norvegicus]